ncbi:hypothetical protein HAX54_022908 [Datura stramonium]|uniref:Uncharacterized protein n=1 Tax=Datura stramonium TaxID=4076 RepID=A0ABS8UV63_DATST|nr:hypothetical protein [Datura stramonium]
MLSSDDWPRGLPSCSWGDGEELQSRKNWKRLQEISIKILRVEEEKLQSEQRLGLFWEHFPPLDPEAVANMMQSIWNYIRDLEGQKEAFLQEQRELTARVARIASDSHRE